MTNHTPPPWCFWALALPTIGWGVVALFLLTARLLE